MNGYDKKGKIEEAWRLFLDMPYKGLEHTTITYYPMIYELFSKGRFADGWKLFNEMEVQKVHPSLHIICWMACGRIGR